MTIFDAPNRDLCEVRRQKTNTPLQALALQNDEQVLEGARVLASKVSQETEDSEEGVRAMFNNILLRDPSGDELELMTDYHENFLEKFQQEADDAEKLVSVGEYEQLDGVDTAETAALMMVAQVLYNLDETITKE